MIDGLPITDIDHADLAPGTPVVLHARVSGRRQADHLQAQVERLMVTAYAAGLVVVGTYREIGHGGADLQGRVLADAIADARDHGAVVLAESADRLLRSPNYHSPGDPAPTNQQWQALADLAGDVPIVTVIPAAANAHADRVSRPCRSGPQVPG